MVMVVMVDCILYLPFRDEAAKLSSRVKYSSTYSVYHTKHKDLASENAFCMHICIYGFSSSSSAL